MVPPGWGWRPSSSSTLAAWESSGAGFSGEPSRVRIGNVTRGFTQPAALTWSGVTARRMGRHALTEPATDLGPGDVAGVLCGAHAQVLSAAELSIGRRIFGATRSTRLRQ
jgi:hypothetical protein